MSGASLRLRTVRWRAILTICATLYEVRRDGYSRADYRIEIEDDDAGRPWPRILALPLFKP